MEVILLERIEKLGQMGDVVQVKDGYARNFLLPREKALRATERNRKRFDVDRAQLETTNLERRKEAEVVAEKMDGTDYVILRQASDMGQLYGSVSSRDIAQALTDGGFSTEKRQINLTAPIKTLGLHAVGVTLHPEVSVGIIVNVARSEAEAEAQGQKSDDGDVPTAAEFFETEDAARDAEENLEEDGGEDSDGAPDPVPVPAATDADES